MSSNPLLDRHPHPGKFEGEINLTEKLYEISLDSGQDEEISGEGFGHYMLFTGLDKDVELGHLGGIVGAILHTTEQGFVEGTYYKDPEYLAKMWHHIEKQYEQWAEEVGDE